MSNLEDIKADLKRRRIPGKPDFSRGLSTSLTLLNLACSGKTSVGFLPGHIIFLVGDSASGKTFLSLTTMAEACLNPAYDGYRLIYDNAEDGALMDHRRYFGKLADRIEPPALHKGQPAFSATVEELYYHIDDAAQAGRPFIYTLDSMDALGTADDRAKFQERKEAHRKGAQVKGSYGMSKAKANSSGLREVLNLLKQSGSILIIIAQTRDNVDPFSFEKKTRSGGKALRFYATEELWFSTKKKLRKVVRGKPEVLGSILQIQVKKNRQTGREPVVEVPFYPSHGFDDVGSCVNFLMERKHWKGAEKRVEAPEFDFSGPPEALCQKIDADESLCRQLRLIVGEVWADIAEQLEVPRRKKY